MLTTDLVIRDIEPTELGELTLLINELGYPTSLEEMETRFRAILAHPYYKTIVAVLNNEIVAMAGFCKGIYYEKNGGYVRILAFVVKQDQRKNGIGKALMAAVEQWAREQGLSALLLTSGIREERLSAYRFYQNMGFAIKSSGFVKEL